MHRSSCFLGLLLGLAFLPRKSHSLVLLRNFRFNGIPSQQPSPSKWLEQVFWENDFSIGDCQDATGRKVLPKRQSSWLHHTRASLVVQGIRIVLLFHLEGPVLRRLPSRLLLEIVQQCLKKEARPKLLCVVATELDRRRQEYQFGDISRYTLKQITKAWKQQFGKDYEFGDITRGLLQRAAQTAESEGWKDRLLEEMESLKSSKRKGKAIQ